jgi:hypothetical protein
MSGSILVDKLTGAILTHKMCFSRPNDVGYCASSCFLNAQKLARITFFGGITVKLADVSECSTTQKKHWYR